MKKKPRKRVKKPISAATRAADEKLREKLRTADMRKFDDVLSRAINPRPGGA